MVLKVVPGTGEGTRQEVKTARKQHICKRCGKCIEPGDQYYARYYGSGLGSLKFPDRLCLECGKVLEGDGSED